MSGLEYRESMNNVSQPHQHQTIVCLMMWVSCFLHTLHPVPHLCLVSSSLAVFNLWSSLQSAPHYFIFLPVYIQPHHWLSLEKLFHVLPSTVCLLCSRSSLLSTSSIHSATCLNNVTPLSSRKPHSHPNLSSTKPQPHRLLPSGETSSSLLNPSTPNPSEITFQKNPLLPHLLWFLLLGPNSSWNITSEKQC